jgi:transcriptional regulator GlxA family with amidase domain
LPIEKLAALVDVRKRNLSRVFKDVTKITIIGYLNKLRVKKAITLNENPNYKIADIALECGFKSPRQLQRILKSATGHKRSNDNE